MRSLIYGSLQLLCLASWGIAIPTSHFRPNTIEVGDGAQNHNGSLLRRGNGTPAPSQPAASTSGLSYGFVADDKTCSVEQIDFITKGVKGMHDLALAAHTALTRDDLLNEDGPFQYFFGSPTEFTLTEISSIYLQAIEYASLAETFPAGRFLITCDPHHEGGSMLIAVAAERYFPTAVIPELADGPPGGIFLKYVNLFPIYFSLPPPSHPCDSTDTIFTDGAKRPRIYEHSTMASTMLHEFAHIISDFKIFDGAYGDQGCHDLVTNPDPARPPFQNADTYMRYARWVQYLGWGSPSVEGQPPKLCPQLFAPDPYWSILDLIDHSTLVGAFDNAFSGSEGSSGTVFPPLDEIDGVPMLPTIETVDAMFDPHDETTWPSDLITLEAPPEFLPGFGAPPQSEPSSGEETVTGIKRKRPPATGPEPWEVDDATSDDPVDWLSPIDKKVKVT